MTWPSAKLGDVCELNPKLPKGHPLRDDTEVSFVPMASVSELSCSITDPQVRPFSEVRKGYTSFCDDDVLFAKITPCMENGKAAIARNLVNGHGFGSTEFHVLRAKAEVLPEWLHFYVRQPAFRHEAKRNFTGTGGQQRVPVSFLAGSDIPLPPLPEQRRIVDLLTRAEGIVRLRREAAAKAAELIPALFIHHFGDPDNAEPQTLATLGSVLSRPIRNGVSPSKAGKHPGKVLTLSAITRGSFDETAVKDSEFASPIADTDMVSSLDMLVCRGNGNKALVGAACFAPRDMPGVAFPDTAIAVRPDQSVVLPPYLETLWATAFIRRQIDAIAKTTNGTYKINQTGLASIRFPVPSLERQRAFGGMLARVKGVIDQQIAAQAKAQATFDALLAQAFAPT